MKLSVFTVALIIAFGCGGEKKVQPEALTEVLDKAIKENTKLKEDFDGKLDELLTLDIASAISGYPASEAKKSPETDIEKEINKISVQYSWDKTNRTRQMEIMGRKIHAPVSDIVSLSWLKAMSLEQFKKENRNLTEEEVAAANQAMQSKVSEMEKDGKITKDQGNLASSIGTNAMKNISYEEVNNVGDYAVFVNQKFAGMPTRDLKVFYKGLSFT
ncbi:MAG TPA: hypothetical protein PKD85_01810 [Saprospiraceae bacterium]|nr:hypothetical protein [Saprospiraceae bacterium]